MKIPAKHFKRSRRKWSRRGYACVDFLAGLVGGVLEYSILLVGSAFTLASKALVDISFRGRRKRNCPQQERSPRAARTASEDPMEPLFQPLGSGQRGVCFDDIAGLEEAKQEISLRMILPLLYPDKASQYRIRRGGGILLYGPPGTGKTMLARAVATELDADFFHIAPVDLMSSEVGGAEKNVAALFRTVRASKRAVLFLDEIDALVPRRRNNGSTIMRRVVSQILGEVDGMRSREEQVDLLLIGATNEIEMIDPAMLRPGRLGARILVGAPGEAARRTLLDKTLAGLPLPDEPIMEQLVQQTDGMTGAEIVAHVQKAADEAFMRAIQDGAPQALHFAPETAARKIGTRLSAV